MSALTAYRAEVEDYSLEKISINRGDVIFVDMDTKRTWNGLDVRWLTWGGTGEINFYAKYQDLSDCTRPSADNVGKGDKQ
jgi:hypothetical protein